MTSLIRVFDHFCRPLAQFSAATTPRSWILNGYGMCEFSLGYDPRQPQAGQLVQERYLQFGNLVHIEHVPNEPGHGTLPTWTGIILPPQNWDYGVCHVTAYSAECILAFRAMPYVSLSGTPKSVLQEMINIVHERASNIVFHPGTLDDAAVSVSDDLRTNAYDHIKKLVRDSGMDFDVTGEVDPRGSLDLFINLYTGKGIDAPVSLTGTNTELEGQRLSIQGTPANQVFGYSQAYTEKSRFFTEAINQGSYDDYGPLQVNQVFVGRHDLASIDAAAKMRVAETGRPVKKIRRVALDAGDLFDHIAVGNRFLVQDTTVGFNPGGGYGFQEKFRVLSVDYNDLSNKAPLHLEAY